MNRFAGEYPRWIEEKLEQIRKKGGVLTVSDDTHTYILLATGERLTGGYSIKVLDAEERVENGKAYILVKAKELKPAPDAIVIQVITYPTAVYRLPKTDLPVKVEWVRE
ncbi:hypothetical protein GCM10010965_20660 [Caldalkalibacillus thermarum]|uniref:protease complex subunit PrcB family protein n=1 Tax=Caldalkalibacillus thermarum TaxID=296745 RepID=UPI001663D81A|nr:protease complex subunit PrcB family protein [Caldalkalibacillus thermarum]GGK27692.1 hypothetical protein GCM10010965_20660 [Caldalkalibacillus thermarum]